MTIEELIELLAVADRYEVYTRIQSYMCYMQLVIVHILSFIIPYNLCTARCLEHQKICSIINFVILLKESVCYVISSSLDSIIAASL